MESTAWASTSQDIHCQTPAWGSSFAGGTVHVFLKMIDMRAGMAQIGSEKAFLQSQLVPRYPDNNNGGCSRCLQDAMGLSDGFFMSGCAGCDEVAHLCHQTCAPSIDHSWSLQSSVFSDCKKLCSEETNTSAQICGCGNKCQDLCFEACRQRNQERPKEECIEQCFGFGPLLLPFGTCSPKFHFTPQALTYDGTSLSAAGGTYFYVGGMGFDPETAFTCTFSYRDSSKSHQEVMRQCSHNATLLTCNSSAWSFSAVENATVICDHGSLLMLPPPNTIIRFYRVIAKISNSVGLWSGGSKVVVHGWGFREGVQNEFTCCDKCIFGSVNDGLTSPAVFRSHSQLECSVPRRSTPASTVALTIQSTAKGPFFSISHEGTEIRFHHAKRACEANRTFPLSTGLVVSIPDLLDAFPPGEQCDSSKCRTPDGRGDYQCFGHFEGGPIGVQGFACAGG